MRTFEIPENYQSPLIKAIKKSRESDDKMKKNFAPTTIDFGILQILLPRHFGLCYGVANAIEIAFRIVAKNPDKRIFLLSEMIHNPFVNQHLREQGIQFLMDTTENVLVSFATLTSDDIVIVPAFGTTLEIEEKLKEIGVTLYDTTCPFVERVWNKAKGIADKNYTIIIHGKLGHEETKSTFSHTSKHSPCIIVKDMQQAIRLQQYILKQEDIAHFDDDFKGQYSTDFNPYIHLDRLAVINQTTMLATETQKIADLIKTTMIAKYNLTKVNLYQHFADTRDTLCYATNDNQRALQEVLYKKPDIAFVVGGYNSSNTSHLVELCEQVAPTYFINSADNIMSKERIEYFDLKQKKMIIKDDFMPNTLNAIKVMIASGASCPDAIAENVIKKIVALYPEAYHYDTVLQRITGNDEII